MATDHILSYFDRDYLAAFDLEGKDRIVTIDRVSGETLTSQGGKKNKKPVVYFVGKEKGLALNKTNARTIMGLYGAHTTAWVGKRITIYPTTTTFGNEMKECIRVRPAQPTEKDDVQTA